MGSCKGITVPLKEGIMLLRVNRLGLSLGGLSKST